MDFRLERNRLFNLRKRNSRWLLILAATGLSGYVVYKVYPHRSKICKLLGTLNSAANLVTHSAETLEIVLKDLKVFLKSDSDEIPRSLRQISKLSTSPELSESLINQSRAVTIGILRASSSVSGDGDAFQSTDFLDRVMNKMFSDSGTGFVSSVAGSFAKNLVIGFLSCGGCHNSGSRDSSQLMLVCRDDKFRALILNCVEKFVGTAVSVFLEKTMHINTYDDFFAGMTNPNHQDNVKDLLVAVSNNAVETLIRTSHEVLSRAKNTSAERPLKKGFKSAQNEGWVDRVSSTLALPTNRKFVLDVTGRVTFETVRSAFEFALVKMSDGVKRSVTFANEEVVGKGIEVVRHIGAKSLIILSLCFALYLHLLGTRGFLHTQFQK